LAAHFRVAQGLAKKSVGVVLLEVAAVVVAAAEHQGSAVAGVAADAGPKVAVVGPKVVAVVEPKVVAAVGL